ncbi:YveK family protein [Gordonia sp. NPDC003429]
MRYFSPRNAISTIVRSWLVVLAVVVAAAVGALVYCESQTPKYEASATLYVSSGSREMPSSTYDSTKGSQERAVSYAKLVYSDAVLEPARSAAGLDESVELRSAVSASVVPATAVLTITSTASSPDEAVKIVNAVSDSLSDAVSRVEVPQGAVISTSRLVLMTPATAQSSPVYPETMLTVLIAAIIGLIVGVIVALTIERFNRKVRDGRDVGALTGAEPVAEISVARSGAGVDLSPGSIDGLVAAIVRDHRTAGTQRILVAALTERGLVQVAVLAAGLAEELVAGGAKVVLLGTDDVPTDLWHKLTTDLTAPARFSAAIGPRTDESDFIVVQGPVLAPSTVGELGGLVDAVVMIVIAKASKAGDLAQAAQAFADTGLEHVHYVLARRTRRVPRADVPERDSVATTYEDGEASEDSRPRHSTRTGARH